MWPFPLVNNERTKESQQLMEAPPEKPLTPYQQATNETNEEALL